MGDDPETPPPGRERFEDCVTYDIPWEVIDRDCLPGGYSGKELEDLCEVPCVFPGREIPTNKEANRATRGLNVEASAPDDLNNLIQCAWALLQENTRLIDFIMCSMTANPNAGDCVKRKIVDEKPDIKFLCWENAPSQATVQDPEGILWGAAEGFALGVTIGGKHGGVVLGIPLAILGAVGGYFSFDDIVIFPNNWWIQRVLNTWRRGSPEDRACACAAMASLLLHETIHTCYRNLDDVFAGKNADCLKADRLEYSFMWMIQQRYPDVGNSPCCWDFKEATTWWAVGDGPDPLDPVGGGC